MKARSIGYNSLGSFGAGVPDKHHTAADRSTNVHAALERFAARLGQRPGLPAADLGTLTRLSPAGPAPAREERTGALHLGGHSLLGVDPERPPSLAGVEQRPESHGRLTTENEPFREELVRRYRRT